MKPPIKKLFTGGEVMFSYDLLTLTEKYCGCVEIVR